MSVLSMFPLCVFLFLFIYCTVACLLLPRRVALYFLDVNILLPRRDTLYSLDVLFTSATLIPT